MIGALAFALLLQNVVEGEAGGRTLPPTTLSAKDLEAVLPGPAAAPAVEGRERLVRKLEAHVAEFVDGFPWRPFHHTLGISAYETLYGHPDRVFLALAEALPHLKGAVREKTVAFLDAQLDALPPWAPEGYDPSQGRAREAYDVPEPYRVKGRAAATGLLGVHAFRLFADAKRAAARWPALKARVQPLLAAEYRFDPAKKDYSRDEAQKLNADLAGLAALVALAREAGDAAAAGAAGAKALDLLQLRVNLERTNPRFLETTRSTTANLHIHKLARYCDLTPGIAAALRQHAPGLAEERLKSFREERNAWWLAFGDRMIGGENYTNPPHFVHALFAGAALVERVPGKLLASWIDVPWCKGDLTFIQALALALSTP